MDKAEALRLLGGTVSTAAAACRISSQAVTQWDDPLTKFQLDRVQAALWRLDQEKNAKTKVADEPRDADGDELKTAVALGYEQRDELTRDDSPQADAVFARMREKERQSSRRDRPE